MMMITKTAQRIQAIVTADGLTINGHVFDRKLPLERYQNALGLPSRTIAAGPPAPSGHRNNQVHVFDSSGIYLTEHHASQLIESVNFVFDPTDSPFPVDEAFCAGLRIDGRQLRMKMQEDDLDPKLFVCDLPGEYTVKYGSCWIGITAKGHRNSDATRTKPRYVVRVSICF